VEKAEELYNLLEEGGVSAHNFITCQAKDLPHIFKKFCTLVSVDLFDIMKETSGIEFDYST